MRILIVALGSLLVACGGTIDGKKTGDGASSNSPNNAQNAVNGSQNAEPNNAPQPNNEPTPINSEPQPNNEPLPINNEPQPNNEPTPVNNEPQPPNAMTGQACNNDADLEAVTTTDSETITRDCQLNCFESPSPRDCTADCVSVEVGTSESCSYCIADFAECGLNNCAEQCIEDPHNELCVECLQAFCDADFVACAGIPAR